MAEIVFVIPSYDGAGRAAKLFESIGLYDPGAFEFPFHVFEDPSRPEVTEEYRAKLEKFPAGLHRLEQWSNLHGAAMKAFDWAGREYNPRWIVYLGDDLVVTPGALTNMTYFLRNNALQEISLVQFPYWNGHDLQRRANSDWSGPGLFWSKHDMYAIPLEKWVHRVPRNPHWDGDGYARPYVNVNGAGFACRWDDYQQVGGFAEGTWCIDESISYKVWTCTPRGIVCLPGPPLVHFFGAVVNAPKHDLHTDEAWTRSIGYSKADCDAIMRGCMADKARAIEAECREANYWTRAEVNRDAA